MADVDRRDVCKIIGMSGLVLWLNPLVAEARWGFREEPPLEHTFHLDPDHAFRRHKEGIFVFTDRVRSQYERTGRVHFTLEFLTSEGERRNGWKFAVRGPQTGFPGKCNWDIGKYLELRAQHDPGRGYQPAGEFHIGVVLKNGKKRIVAYNVEKQQCQEESADEAGLRKIIKWVLVIAAAIIGVKIAIWLLPLMVFLTAAVLFIVLAKVLWDAR